VTPERSEDGQRPSRRHANIIRNRGRSGHDEHQLARGFGVTRETLRKWAKSDKAFALALQEALDLSRRYWDDSDQRVKVDEEFETLRARRGYPQPKPKAPTRQPPKPAISAEALRAQRERERLEQEQDDAAWDNALGKMSHTRALSG
jgi:hypothetical protein